jgi:fibronectin type 3 domain-containing protein
MGSKYLAFLIVLLMAAAPFLQLDMEPAVQTPVTEEDSTTGPVLRSDIEDATVSLSGLVNRFTENLGQSEGAGRFYCRGDPLSVSFGAGWVAYDLQGDEGGALYRVRFDGGKPVEPQGVDPLTHRSNFFLGNDPDRWVTGARSFREVRYASLYDGIDLSFYFEEGSLKYDFVLEPGADPGDIGLAYEAVEGLSLDLGGDLLVHTTAGTLREEAPWTYQEGPSGRTTVESAYRLVGDGTVELEIGQYDRSSPLVIDPRFNFSTFVGGNRMDIARGTIVDDEGNVIVAGLTGSDGFPNTTGAYCNTYNGMNDLFVFKLKHDGSDLLWSTFVGGERNEEVFQLMMDPSGDLWVAGRSGSPNFPTTSGVYQETSINVSAVVFRMKPTGDKLVYSTFVGGSRYDYARGMGLDAQGNVYLAGDTDSADFPNTTGSYNTSYGGNFDAFVVKLSPDLKTLIYGTFIGSPDGEETNGMFVDASGYSYVVGRTNSADFPTTSNAYMKDQVGSIDVFLLKLNPAGTDLVFSTYLGGTDNEYYPQVKVDDDGHVYVTGHTSSTNFPTTQGVVYMRSRGGQDGFLTKLNASGDKLLVSSYFGTAGSDGIYAMDFDADGTTYIGGDVSAGGLPVTENGDETYNGGVDDAFICRLNSNWSKVEYCSYLGGSASEGISRMGLVRGAVNTTVVVNCRSDDFPTTNGSYNRTFNNIQDIAVCRLATDKQVGWLPSAPINFTLTVNIEDDSIFLQWDPPEDSGNLRIRGYNIYHGSTEDVPELLKINPPDMDFYRIQPIVYGTTYYFAVRAFNFLGEGNFSVVLNVTPIRHPYETLGLDATASCETVRLTWSPPLMDGGRPLLGYQLERGDSLDTFEPLVELELVTEYNDTGLMNGQTYYYRVRAFNDVNPGDWSGNVSAKPIGPPSVPPLDLRATPGKDVISLQWRRPYSDGGKEILGYKVHRGESEASLTQLTEVEIEFSFDDADVVIGVTYFYRISAFNELGDSPMSISANATLLGLPGAPRDFTLAFDGEAIQLGWDPPDTDGGSPILGYRVYRGAIEDYLVHIADVMDGTTYSDTEFVLGETYYYRVHAYTDQGEGPSSGKLPVVPLRVPTVPTGVAVIVGEGQLQVQWQKPTETGGSPLTGYVLYRGESEDDVTKLVVLKAQVTRYIDEDIVGGLTYYYKVAAVTDAGEGPMCDAASGMSLGRPGQPRDLNATAGNGKVDITWSAPENDGGSPLTTYKVYRGLSVAGLAEVAEVATTEYTDTDVTNGVTYFYAITASNAIGEGLLCADVEATPERPSQDRPDALTTFELKAEEGKVVLAWLAPTWDGDSPITNYVILRGRSEANLVLLVEVGDVHTYTDTDVEGGMTYYYSIFAKNALGQANPSPTLSVEVEKEDERKKDDGPGFAAAALVLALGTAALVASSRRGRR